jgi:ribosomal protein L11 methyltransferase
MLWQVSLTTSVEAEESVSALFENLFSQPSVVYVNAEARTSTVSAYRPRLPRPRTRLRARLRAGLKHIRLCGLNTGLDRITIRKVRQEDWALAWRKHFHPLEIGRALLIKPSWSRRRPRPGQAVVVLDPGLSFGTGQHPTTAFCLEQLVLCRKTGQAQSFLDIGTGSGILAIAAAKLGYRPVEAVDIDPNAVRIAGANARQNLLKKHIRIVRQDLIRWPCRRNAKFDVLCANLSDDLLIGQARRIVNRLQTGGTLILAGVLKTQFGRVRNTYAAAGLKVIALSLDKEWQSAAFAYRR